MNTGQRWPRFRLDQGQGCSTPRRAQIVIMREHRSPYSSLVAAGEVRHKAVLMLRLPTVLGTK